MRLIVLILLLLCCVICVGFSQGAPYNPTQYMPPDPNATPITGYMDAIKQIVDVYRWIIGVLIGFVVALLGVVYKLILMIINLYRKQNMTYSEMLKGKKANE